MENITELDPKSAIYDIKVNIGSIFSSHFNYWNALTTTIPDGNIDRLSRIRICETNGSS